MKESEIERRCKLIAEKEGYKVRKMEAINCRGFPDRLFLKKGRAFFVEFKTPTGKTSELQKIHIEDLKQSGLEVYIIKSIEEFKGIL